MYQVISSTFVKLLQRESYIAYVSTVIAEYGETPLIVNCS